MTLDKQHTLAPETFQILAALPQGQPVMATAFFTARTPSDTAKSTLDDFKYNSNGRFDYQFVDPDANPVAAQNAKITQDGTIVLTLGTHSEQVTLVNEQEIDSALVKLEHPGTRVVYFLTGHGEHSPEDTGNTAYSLAKNALTLKNYTVQTLNLAANPQVPQDALAIIIAGPQKPLSDNEVKLLQAYLDKGGSLVVMEEPLPVTNFGDSPDPLATYLTQSWGVTLGKDFVIDPGANPVNVAIANEYGDHLITNRLQGMITAFPTARSVTVNSINSKITSTILVKTSSRAWGETDFAGLANNQVTPDSGKDLLGPVPVAVAAQDSDTKARLVVIGDSDFATDAFFNQYGNGDFLVNAIDWAAQQESLINLNPTQPTQRFMVPPERATMGLILLFSVFLIPGLVVASGITVWLQRRRRM